MIYTPVYCIYIYIKEGARQDRSPRAVPRDLMCGKRATTLVTTLARFSRRSPLLLTKTKSCGAFIRSGRNVSRQEMNSLVADTGKYNRIDFPLPLSLASAGW